MEFKLPKDQKLEIKRLSKKTFGVAIINKERKIIPIGKMSDGFYYDCWPNKILTSMKKKGKIKIKEINSSIAQMNADILLNGVNKIFPQLTFKEISSEKKEIEKKPDDITNEEKTKGLDILEHGDPIKFIGDTIQLMHVGDYEQGVCLWLGTLTPELGYKLHTLAVGSTGVGKSDLLRKVCRCVPASKRIKLDSASSKALYYAVKAGVNIDGVVFNIDDVDPEDSDQIKLLKMMATDDPDELKHWTLSDDRKFVELICSRRFVVFASTIESLTDKQGQLLRRYEVLNPSEGDKALEGALTHIKSEVRAGKSEEEYPRDFNVAQAISKEIKEQKLKIVIPFDFNFPSGGFTSKTALKKFATLIWAIAKARFKQRIIIDDTVLAQPEDFELAVKLWGKRQPLKIDETAMRVLNCLGDEEPTEHVGGSEDNNVKFWDPEPKTATTLARDLKLAPRTVRDKLGHLYDAGWADRKQTGGRGKPWAFWRAPGVSDKIGQMVERGEDIRHFTASPKTLPSIDHSTLSASLDDYDDQFRHVKDEYKKRMALFVSSYGSGSERHNHQSKDDPSTKQSEEAKEAKPLKTEDTTPKLEKPRKTRAERLREAL